jgi:hypothetical protein
MDDVSRSSILSAIADKTMRDGGATFDFKALKFIVPKNLWYFPKYPGLTRIVGQDEILHVLTDFLDKNSILYLEDDVVFGTWLNPDSGKVYLDINTFEADRATALRQAKAFSLRDGRNIVSMYNPASKETVFIAH